MKRLIWTWEMGIKMMNLSMMSSGFLLMMTKMRTMNGKINSSVTLECYKYECFFFFSDPLDACQHQNLASALSYPSGHVHKKELIFLYMMYFIWDRYCKGLGTDCYLRRAAGSVSISHISFFLPF